MRLILNETAAWESNKDCTYSGSLDSDGKSARCQTHLASASLAFYAQKAVHIPSYGCLAACMGGAGRGGAGRACNSEQHPPTHTDEYRHR